MPTPKSPSSVWATSACRWRWHSGSCALPWGSISTRRVEELQRGRDSSRECSPEGLAEATQLRFSSQPADLGDCRIFIIAVPTPINAHKRPDLSHLESASELVGQALKPSDLVIVEATVYPCCTEEICVPILERLSGLQCASEESQTPIDPSQTFHLGYSPERIHPGDIAEISSCLARFFRAVLTRVGEFD